MRRKRRPRPSGSSGAGDVPAATQIIIDGRGLEPRVNYEYEDEPRVARRDRFSSGLIARAQRIFGERMCREVSEEEARIMLGNLTDFYELAIVRQRRLRRMDAMHGSAKSTK